jgi:mannose-1-phosphate guanylyltransferase/mannose-6-phosphate isomerase
MGKDKNLYAVILAGGSGTRFWPVSRQSLPKQFLNLAGKGSLLQQTLRRINLKIPSGNIFIVSNRLYREEVERQVVGFGVVPAHILWEPEGKNTAPAVCWAAARIHAVNPRAVMAVLPSDHFIKYHSKFLKVLAKAVDLAGKDYLVTFGIVPTRPETGYGYLKTVKVRGKDVFRVEKFIEKPNLARAKQFLRTNCRDRLETSSYMWNSGMFVWRTQTILEAFRQYLPGIFRMFVGTGFKPVPTERMWHKLPVISIDYGILERAKNVAAVPAVGIGWSDVGSWEALSEILPKDKAGNTTRGSVVSLDCRDTLIWARQRLVAAVGLKDILVIDTPDALLVCPKHLSQEVKNLVSILKQHSHPQT